MRDTDRRNGEIFMKVEIIPSSLTGSLSAIASKSDAHRAIICSALADDKTTILITETSDDIDATLSCIESMGATVLRNEKNFTISPVYEVKDGYVLDCNESGSTLRFLLPVSASLGKKASFTGRGRLPQRPMSPIINLLREKEIEFSGDTLPFTLNGKLESGEYRIDGNVSSQFISGLLFALSIVSGKSKIELISPLQSKAYVDMTIDTLKSFGIDIRVTDTGYEIEGKDKLISPKEYIVEGDWSNSAFFLVAGALSGDIKLRGLNINSNQSDKSILDILKLAGAEFKIENDGILVKKSEIEPFSLDVSECPDLFPILSVLACKANGKTTLYNAKRLRIKESDRIKSTKELILNLGGKAEETEDSLIIFGTGRLLGGKVQSFNDHRIVMSAFVASIICEEKVEIEGAEAINKSYPDFIRDFKGLGGKVNVI